MKKLLSVLLAAVMLLAMAGVAMAAMPTGQIVIKNVESGVTATAYKIIGWTLDDASGEPVAPGNEWADTQVGDWMTSKSKSLATLEQMSSREKSELFNEMYNAIGAKLTSAGSATASSTEVTIGGLEIGTYLIIISGENAHKTYSAIVANVGYVYDSEKEAWTPVNGEAEAKSVDIPDIDKKINQAVKDGHDADKSDTVSIGDIVTFDIYAPVPNYPDDATYTKFEIYDVMCDGLTFLTDEAHKLKVMVETANGEVEFNGYTPKTTAGKIFDLDFIYDDLKKAGATKVHIQYQAQVNQNIQLGVDTNTNDVYLDYQKNPYVETDYDTKQDEVKVYTFALKVVKYGDGNESNLLGGAQFKLYKKNGTTPLKFKLVDGVYVVSEDGNIEILETSSADDDTKGLIVVKGLKDGNYEIEEVKAPATYNKMNGKQGIHLKQDKGEGKFLENGETEVKYRREEKINNEKGPGLPATGGMGTTIFMVAGIAVMACAVVALMVVLKRQKKQNEG